MATVSLCIHPRERVAELAREAQELHTARRQRVEQFLRDAGTSPAASSSRNPLEQPWTLTAQEFARRAPRTDPQLFTQARDETLELTERIATVECEIDERVAALYGVENKWEAGASQEDRQTANASPFA